MGKIQITKKVYYEQDTHAFFDGKRLILTLPHSQARLFDLILTLGMRCPVRKEQLINELWGKEAFFDFSPAINQKIYTLRKELKTIELDDLIITVPRVGYKINSIFSIVQGKETTTVNDDGGFWQRMMKWIQSTLQKISF
ncbi:winged helix-turn-helix domain-containing protein [Serratia proteamaculans]|uniref:OmpR/PhoB-type domain-containing protein n=1 Tax=Serratia proteamaculans TaxID=28151 RepID=A0A5Q2VF76_SERPR|nr:winged helix-turn-helix domain-containing protein [Serratia proteamaculans]QGH62043.1 hypothetical protein GHV41_14960 [Serratia proteamaculans]